LTDRRAAPIATGVTHSTAVLPEREAAHAIALPMAHPPFRDRARVMRAAVFGMCRALLSRLVGRRVHPRWGLGLELVVAATRGAWSVMPLMGMVRWRDVGEAMSPLRCDGLTPRFVNLAAGDEDPLYAAWLEPPDAGPDVLLYFHGGGFVFGSLRTHGELIGGLARAARVRTLALQYRLAPEHPAPAAVTDALRAYRALLDRGIAPGSIALGGDSAGGTLVLNALLAIRDAGLPLPACAVVLSPWVDLGCSGVTFDENARYDFVGKEHCLLAASHYLGDRDPASPDVSPLFARLDGLPPLLVHAGSQETLVAQIRAFVARARDAGVAITFSEYSGMVHVWHLLRAVTPDAQRAIDEAGAFIRARGVAPA